MTQEQDELQAKEFLSRTEIITMKKDLKKLREFDALAERNKIVRGEPNKSASAKATADKSLDLKEAKEKFEREKVLDANRLQEIEAEKQLKDYASEEEKQRIFILESERINLEKKAKEDRARKEPELAMKKNELNLQKEKIVEKLNGIVQQERKIEDEEKFLGEKEKTTNIPEEKKSLEQGRWDLEKKREEIEKQRWEIERETLAKDKEIETVDTEYNKMVQEENNLKQQITEIDKQLRAIYAQIITRVQEVKKQEEFEKKSAQGERAKIEAKEKEAIQRQQWTKTPSMQSSEKEFLKGVPSLAKQKLSQQAKDEEENRKKFLQDVEAKAIEEEKQK